jgi:hypothetical protein
LKGKVLQVIDLVKCEGTGEMSLYVIGTIMAKWAPVHFSRISMRSREFGKMDRGYFKKHLYQYTKEMEMYQIWV